MSKISTALMIAALLPFAAHAEGEATEKVEMDYESVSIRNDQCSDCPTRGMTMQGVEERHGAPQEMSPAVGKPPISRWIYEDFTVYFEANYVLHSVVNKKK